MKKHSTRITRIVLTEGQWTTDPRDLTGTTRIDGPCTVAITWMRGEATGVEVTR